MTTDHRSPSQQSCTTSFSKESAKNPSHPADTKSSICQDLYPGLDSESFKLKFDEAWDEARKEMIENEPPFIVQESSGLYRVQSGGFMIWTSAKGIEEIHKAIREEFLREIKPTDHVYQPTTIQPHQNRRKRRFLRKLRKVRKA